MVAFCFCLARESALLVGRSSWQ
ncbi:hypothetical protein NP493_123g00007 [Ridgeia piscesae]|uniref:Uncharacterized protein n=1 Tax=Ridgeia piscesae TaxID=27915 RepID=A0AAD9UGX0_RIDPI|nr:hypothetical protein NP493_123g00007 [Ridgeia piscesae]